MLETLLRIARHYPVTVHQLEMDSLPQLLAYQHSIDNYSETVDWMAFIDGDEFLFSPLHRDMEAALLAYDGVPLSALGVYWMCYGSNGHLNEPEGLILQNYPRHSSVNFPPNRHVKTILRGHEAAVANSSHLFVTRQGTFDENLRPVTQGWMNSLEPTYQALRINHYPIQSYQYFIGSKQTMGAADGDPHLTRSVDWYMEYDRNECDDGISYNFLIPVKLKMQEIYAAILRE